MCIRRITPLLLLLAACGTGTRTAETTASPSPTDPPRTAHIETNCETQEGADRDVRMLLNDVEVSTEEEGFERVIFSFEAGEGEDAGVPYWHVTPTEPPLREAGSGDLVEVAGEAFWEVTIWASGVDLSGEEFREVYTGPDRIEPDEADLVAEVVKAGDFENTLTFYVGTTAEACVRVETGTDPVRIHVDLASAS